MYQGGKFDLNRNVIVGYEGTLGFQPETEDCVRIKGSIEGKFEGQNAFGATINAVTIKANDVKKMDCKDVIYPVKKTINVDESKTKDGVTLTLRKIEFADEHTRIYLKINNNAGGGTRTHIPCGTRF